MRFWNKEKTIVTYKETFKGDVDFILNGNIEQGVIFGKPFTELLIGGWVYHVRKGDKVYDIKEHAIERRSNG